MQPTTSATPDDGPLDWLGYQQYAQAVWSRVVHGFAQEGARREVNGKPPRTEAPAGDPMVIGVYGEWGVGKSRLLELTYALAAAQSAQDCAQRALDPDAYQSTQALRLTVPVWFHPWKYEHEEHLAVPMLMHVADAVRTTLKDSEALAERTAALIHEKGEALGKTAQEIASAAKKGSAFAKRVAKVTHAVASNGLVKTATGVAAGFVGLAPATEAALDWIAETSEKLAGEKDDDEGKRKDDKEKDKKPEAPADTRPTHSADGRYYYNVQKYLRDLAHITPEKAREHGVRLRHEVHLNFVVFVDDLDRCLPEKAVEVLEVIKTVLNIECFAFLVALDDEVIERGISHRYRDYRFKDAKPEMPITGFEYLEKIVHLPFRLPQLTRAQAAAFVRHQEDRLLEPVPNAAAASTHARLWYTSRAQPTGLVTLLLDSFEAYVPRKLARTIELMHQFQQVLAARNIPMQIGAPGQAPLVDARMVLFTVLMQLFAPEVFRLLRRRPGIFGQWMRANLAENATTSPVFEWRKSTDDDALVLEVSDSDLYRWAAMGSQASPSSPAGAAALPRVQPPFDGARLRWSEYLGVSAHSQSDRHSVEQLRLPFAVAIGEFRDTQRHAFSPLRLGAAMAYAMAWTYTDVPSLQSYMQLFGDSVGLPDAPQPAPMPVFGNSSIEPPEHPAQAAAKTRLVKAVNAREMLELISSPDAATRASLVERLGLRSGDIIDTAAVDALASTLPHAGSGTEAAYLTALSALSPYLDPSAVKQHHWADLPAWTLGTDWGPLGLGSGSHAPDFVLEAAAPYAQLHAYGLANALGLQTSVDEARHLLHALASSGTLDAAQQAQAANLLSQMGNPAFSEAA